MRLHDGLYPTVCCTQTVSQGTVLVLWKKHQHWNEGEDRETAHRQEFEKTGVQIVSCSTTPPRVGVTVASRY